MSQIVLWGGGRRLWDSGVRSSQLASSSWSYSILTGICLPGSARRHEPRDHLHDFRCAGRHDMILFRWHYYWIFSYLEGSFQVDIFMMDLWVYRDSIYIQIVGTHWHFNSYFTIVLDVCVWFWERGSHMLVTANPSLLCCPRCDKHYL